MAINRSVQIKFVILMIVLLFVSVPSTEGQWSQTIGWGSAGLGKRAEHSTEGRKNQCIPNPIISSLIIQLSKYESDRLKQCEMAVSLEDI